MYPKTLIPLLLVVWNAVPECGWTSCNQEAWFKPRLVPGVIARFETHMWGATFPSSLLLGQTESLTKGILSMETYVAIRWFSLLSSKMKKKRMEFNSSNLQLAVVSHAYIPIIIYKLKYNWQVKSDWPENLNVQFYVMPRLYQNGLGFGRDIDNRYRHDRHVIFVSGFGDRSSQFLLKLQCVNFMRPMKVKVERFTNWWDNFNYVMTTLCLRDYDAVGFDLDHTLAKYNLVNQIQVVILSFYILLEILSWLL